ncbi:MAG: murein biosynthesis integral membrane protein MurJ [Myxococcota bacterium]
MSGTLASSAKVSAAILGSRVLGLVREVVFASLFGAGAVADAYHVAFRIPNLLRDLFAEGALSAAFVPTFTQTLHDDGEERAHALGNLAASALLLMTGALVGLGLLFAEPLVAAISGGFAGDDAKVALAVRLTRIMMPFLCLVSLSAVWMGMLNARRHFVVPAVAPAMFNVVSLVVGGAVWLRGGTANDGVAIWSAGTLLAGAFQGLTQLPTLWRLGYRPWPRLGGLFRHPGIRRIARLMAPALVGVAAIQINVFVNTKFAGSLGDGAVAQLTYAFRLFFLPLGMFGVAIATVTTTGVAEEAAKGDHDALRRRAATSVSAGWMLTSASAVGLAVLAEPVCTLIYRHGATTAADVEAIAWVLRAYVCGLVPYALVKIVAPAFYAIDRPRVPLLASTSAVVVNIAFNALTYRTLGPPGIALGTGLGALVNLIVLRISFRRVLGPLPASRRVAHGSTLLAANVAMGAVVFGGWMVAAPWLEPVSGALGTTALAVALAVLVGAGFAVFAAIAGAFGYPGADALWRIPKKILRR